MSNKKKFEQPIVDLKTVEELSNRLLEANRELKHAEYERRSMIENISHDLRAPLTAIRSTVDYLTLKNRSDVEDITDEDLSTFLKLLDMRTRTLEVLVQDLYYLTCIESGSEKFKFKKVPIAQFLEEYYFAAEIDEKYADYELVLDVPEDMKEVVAIDIAKLSRVLDNLFNNSRKYSVVGCTITLGVYQVDKDICIYVKDNGQGISEKAIPHIFDRTYRESDSRTPEEETSSGLGLSIVKSIVEQHKGKVECKSKLGEGSTIFIYLPKIG
ncbi:sensor histidine kinase [Butyrivibrio sp. AE3004]|uniref:sensor histidine kinase n=1 Tax=Butyrivibrio sp. AE3004 TaxID=1506994 RepID=UPI0004943978|nr:HAMP domain-containing sensor histidine kinase [Butyrivibrio sp. AE3004]